MSGSSGIAGRYLLKDLERYLDPAKRRAHLYTLHHLLDAREHVTRDRDALGERRFLSLVLRLAHPRQYFFGHRNAGDFVCEKLGVAQRDERPDARHNGRLELLDFLQEGFELARVEHRLRDRKLRPRIDLPREARQLAILTASAGIHADADNPLRRAAERIVARIEPLIQAIHQIRETDRVDVEYRGRFRIRAHLRRIARDDENVAQPRGVRADDVGEHAEQVAVAATVMNDGLDADLALDEYRRWQHAHATLRAGAVGHVDHIDDGRFQRPALCQHRGRIHALGRHDFDAGDELATGEFRAPARPLGDRHRHDARGRLHLCARDDDARLPWHHARDVVADLLDVLGRRAAAAADEPRARLDHATRIARHVLGGGEIDLAIPDVFRQAGVRLRGDGPVRRLDDLLDRLEHAGGTDGTVHADDIGAPRGQLLGERLQDEAVDTAREQAPHLPGERRLCFCFRRWAEGLEANPEGPDGAEDARAAAGGGARQLGSRAIDLFRLVREAVAVQLQRIGAEGVGLENLGAGAYVLRVHLLHQPRLLEVQLVVADVQEEALGIQHRAHGAIEHMDATIL